MDQDKKKKYFNTGTRFYRQVDQDKKKYFNTETRLKVDQDKKKTYFNTETRFYRQVDKDKKKNYFNTEKYNKEYICLDEN